MGDVVSLVERAAQEVSEDEAKRLHEHLKKNKFDYKDRTEHTAQVNISYEEALKKVEGNEY